MTLADFIELTKDYDKRCILTMGPINNARPIDKITRNMYKGETNYSGVLATYCRDKDLTDYEDCINIETI